MTDLMDRRMLLKLASALALVGCAQDKKGQGLNVVVVGAGIVGAAIAYRLARAGASVTIIDRAGPATHASRGTFAWINATWAKQPRSYHALTQKGVSGWGDLQKQLKIPVKWGGSLEWFASDARNIKLAEQIAEQARWGEPSRMVAASELAAMEPNLAFDNVTQVAFSGNDGAVDPVLATEKLLAAAQSLGVQVIYPCELQNVERVQGRLKSVTTSKGTLKADRLVLATGADPFAPKLAADVDIPQRTTPGVIAITGPMPALLNRIIAAPGVHMHQRADGRIVLGEQEGAPDNEAHKMRLEGRPNDFPSRDFANQHAEHMIAIAQEYLPSISDASIENVFIGWRPLPLDGHPVIGASPKRQDVYLAIMHSGISLAPIASQLASHELITGEVVASLAEFRPGREFQTVQRY